MFIWSTLVSKYSSMTFENNLRIKHRYVEYLEERIVRDRFYDTLSGDFFTKDDFH